MRLIGGVIVFFVFDVDLLYNVAREIIFIPNMVSAEMVGAIYELRLRTICWG
jgi:hypothetical protein